MPPFLLLRLLRLFKQYAAAATGGNGGNVSLNIYAGSGGERSIWVV